MPGSCAGSVIGFPLPLDASLYFCKGLRGFCGGSATVLYVISPYATRGSIPAASTIRRARKTLCESFPRLLMAGHRTGMGKVEWCPERAQRVEEQVS